MQKRTTQRVHTRKIDRMVAHNVMRAKGMTGVNKPYGGESFFSTHWREAGIREDILVHKK